MPWSSAYGQIKGALDCSNFMQYNLGWGFGGLKGKEFCDLVTRFNSKVCLPASFIRQADVPMHESYCVVDSQCQGTRDFVKANFDIRKCQTGDTVITDLKMPQLAQLARENSVDVGVLAQWGAGLINEPSDHLGPETITDFQKLSTPLAVWTPEYAGESKPRLHINGPEVYRLTYNKGSPMHWDVECLKGCK